MLLQWPVVPTKLPGQGSYFPQVLQVLTADGSSEKSLLGEGHKTQDIPKPGMAHISAPFNPAKNIRAQELTTITSKDREGKRDHV